MLKLLFALPGFHRFDRGAEVALLGVARELAAAGDEVIVVGSGPSRDAQPYDYRRIATVDRRWFERLPAMPVLRTPENWEEMIFAARLALAVRAESFDAVITCSFPFTHWALKWAGDARRPLQIYVTQNGDWPALSRSSEYRTFRCDGLVCTNPVYHERNSARWPSALIPNGVDISRFTGQRHPKEAFGLRPDLPVVLMVSALIPSKRVREGIEAVAALGDAQLVIAGDGPLRAEIDQLGAARLGPRYRRLTLPAAEMPKLYGTADAFLHLSRDESFGNVFVEARASGLPTVAHDTANTRWIVGEDQFLCDSHDPVRLRETIAAALARGQGEAPIDIERFSWPVIAGRYRAFISELRSKAA